MKRNDAAVPPAARPPLGRQDPLSPLVPAGLVAIAVFVAAFNLRPAVASLGAVLDQAVGELGGTPTLAGLLTALPGLCFAVFGVLAVPIARRTGLTGALTLGMLIELVGLALRPWVCGIWSFVFLTGLCVIGIAVGNVLLPAFIKRHGGVRTVALMTVYSTLLGVGSTIAPLTALPFGARADGWRWGLAVWAIAGAVQLLVWVFVWPRAGYDLPPATATDRAAHTRIWKSPTAVAIMLFFGLQSMNAYIQMGWLPTMLGDGGASASQASLALAITGFMQILGGLVMPTITARAKNLWPFTVLFALLMTAGYAGILVAPAAGWLAWALLLGLGGLCFPTALSLITARTRDPMVTARLSGFAQPVGYLLAAAGPFLVGTVHGAIGGWTPILVVLIILGLVLALLGFRAAKSAVVDDELAAHSADGRA
ncbi:MFS transporter [Brevibacterium moorei]|uniref:MFS transporter n=1 Tax=Brevibacterium moorei TaxID=2968457 RepID=UPI00211C00FA|nr:MFS transporter [Brevibacterium sp. 68QC2CO]MCQ9384199.1 MFS transporter [Brevibacterium sp. 68QC2CO]